MNIIVICSDTFRYDHLGFIKKQQIQTPHLDILAKESGIFTDFWLCSFPTVVNRIEVFTGRYTFPFYAWGPLPYEFPVLAQIFQKHGFTTAFMADNVHLMKKGYGFERGFHFVKDIPGQTHDNWQPPSAPMIDLPCPEEKLEPSTKRLNRYRRNAYWYQQQKTNTTEILFRCAIEWLEQPPQKFFLWIDAFDPHEPWDAPAPFLQLYPWNNQGDRVIWPKSGYADMYSSEDIENMRALYKAEVTQIDYWLGNFINQLQTKGLLENTAIIFCSDHGYYFGEHGLLGKPHLKIKKPTPIYEELGHIPLLIRHPKGLSAGKTIRGLCQPPDIFATSIDLAEIPKVPWNQGNSLIPQLEGNPGNQRFAVGGCHPHEEGGVGGLTVLTDEWCLIYSPLTGINGSELYNMTTDPTQTCNVIEGNNSIAKQLFEMMNDWFDQIEVSSARKHQLLYNTRFTRWHNFQYLLRKKKKRYQYTLKYRKYTQGK